MNKARLNDIKRALFYGVSLSIIGWGIYFIEKEYPNKIGIYGAFLLFAAIPVTICAVSFLLVTLMRIGIAIIDRDLNPVYDPTDGQLFRIANCLILGGYFIYYILLNARAFNIDGWAALAFFVLFVPATMLILIISAVISFIQNRKKG